MMIKSFAVFACLLILMTFNAEARTIAQSGPEKVPLIESYTSEGCSSCVSAWIWLAKIEKERGLWSSFVPIDFHVEYWDYLGWNDRFSDKRFSERQSAYAALWGHSSIYTPELVANGREWRSWRSDALSSTFGPREERPGVLTVSEIKPAKYEVQFQSEKIFDRLTAHFALIVSDYASPVKRGENAGRRLEHHFMVVAYEEVPLKKGDNSMFQATTTLAFPDETKGAKQGIVVFITDNYGPAPLQAAGGYLPEKDPA